MSTRSDAWDGGCRLLAPLVLLSLVSGCSRTAVSSARLTAAANDYDPYFVESAAVTRTSGPNCITRAILQDRKGHMWLASWEGIIRYDGQVFTNHMNQDGLRRSHTFAAFEDRSGGLWFGTIGAGVYRFDGTSFSNLTTEHALASAGSPRIHAARSGSAPSTAPVGNTGSSLTTTENEALARAALVAPA